MNSLKWIQPDALQKIRMIACSYSNIFSEEIIISLNFIVKSFVLAAVLSSCFYPFAAQNLKQADNLAIKSNQILETGNSSPLMAMVLVNGLMTIVSKDYVMLIINHQTLMLFRYGRITCNGTKFSLMLVKCYLRAFAG